MIKRLRLTLAGSLIGGLMIWACGGEETTTSPGGQQQQLATQLAFTVEPTTTTVASSSIMPAVQVAIQGALGNLGAGATDAVTVAIGTNPGRGTLSGTTTVNAVAGVASFTDLTIDQVGTGYTLVATSGSLSSATSAAFGIFPPQPAPPTLSGDVQPIFSGVCAVPGCHAGTTPEEALNLSQGLAHSNIVNVSAKQLAGMLRVRPGQPDQSYLVHKIQGTQASVGGTGNRMPLVGTPLTQAQIDTIRDWIAAGAPKN